MKHIRRFSASFYIGAGRNFIRNSELTDEMEAHLNFGSLHEASDANGKPIATIAAVKIPIRLGRFLDLLDVFLFVSTSQPLSSSV